MRLSSESTSSSLLRQAQQDDEVAWRRLAKLYGPIIYRWARRVGLSEEDSADIGQEVFRVLAVKLADFEVNQSGFRSWLWQICRNKIGDFFRRTRHNERAIGGSGSLLNDLANYELPVDFDDDAIADDRQEVFAAALRLIQTDFEARTWKAFWRATIEEQPVKHIAEDLQMTTKAVRQAKYRVLKRLRDEFGDLLS